MSHVCGSFAENCADFRVGNLASQDFNICLSHVCGSFAENRADFRVGNLASQDFNILLSHVCGSFADNYFCYSVSGRVRTMNSSCTTSCGELCRFAEIC